MDFKPNFGETKSKSSFDDDDEDTESFFSNLMNDD